MRQIVTWQIEVRLWRQWLIGSSLSSQQRQQSYDNYNSHTFIMSFGKYEYQHRFYRPDYHKKTIHQQPFNSLVLPPAELNHNGNYLDHSRHLLPIYNDLNSKVRPHVVQKNQLGWEGYNLKTRITNEFSNNYQYHCDVLERFRREAEEYKKSRKYKNHYIPLKQDKKQQNLYQSPKIHSPKYVQELSPKIEEQEYQNLYENNEEVRRYDVGIMTKVQEEQKRQRYQQNQKLMEKLNKYKIRHYKKKYKDLKDKLKEEILDTMERNKELERQEKQRRELTKVQQMEKLMKQISEGLTKNSLLLNQSIKIRKLTQSSYPNSHVFDNGKRIIEQEEAIENDEAEMKIKHQQELSRLNSKIMELSQKAQKHSPKVIYPKRSLEIGIKQLNESLSQDSSYPNERNRLKTK